MLTDEIPAEILTEVRHAIVGLDSAMQALRKARDYARIEAGVGKGLVDRDEFVRLRRQSRVSLSAIRADRATLARFREAAADNGIDGEAVVRSLWADLKAERRAEPSGRYYDCRRVERERRAAYLASLAPLPMLGLAARHQRHGYDARGRLASVLPEIGNPYGLTPAEHRRQAARILRARHRAKVATWRAEQAREAVRESLRARGKQTPERVELAARIRRDLAFARMGFRAGLSLRGVRRHYLDAKRRRREPAEKTAERVQERLSGCPWVMGVQAEGESVVVLASNLRAARKAIPDQSRVDGKAVVVRTV